MLRTGVPRLTALAMAFAFQKSLLHCYAQSLPVLLECIAQAGAQPDAAWLSAVLGE